MSYLTWQMGFEQETHHIEWMVINKIIRLLGCFQLCSSDWDSDLVNSLYAQTYDMYGMEEDEMCNWIEYSIEDNTNCKKEIATILQLPNIGFNYNKLNLEIEIMFKNDKKSNERLVEYHKEILYCKPNLKNPMLLGNLKE